MVRLGQTVLWSVWARLETAVVRMGLVMLAEIAEKKDDYNKFYEQFDKFLKLGIHVDSTIDGSIALCTSTIGASTMAFGSGSQIPFGTPTWEVTPAGRFPATISGSSAIWLDSKVLRPL